MTSESKKIDVLSNQILEVNKELGSLTKITKNSTDTIASLSEELAKANKMNDTNSKGIFTLIDMIKDNKSKIDNELNEQSENFSGKFKDIYKVIESNSGNLVKIYDSVKRHTSQLEEKEVILKQLQKDILKMKKQVDKLKPVKGENKVELGEENGEDTVNMADISKDDIFRYFEFNKSWQDSDLIKKWGDSKIVYSVAFNVLPIFQYGQQREFEYPSGQRIPGAGSLSADKLNSSTVLVRPCTRYTFDKPKSIKNSILEVERFFQLKMTKSYMDIVECINDKSRLPDHANFTPRLSFTDYLSKETVNGFFLRRNNISAVLEEDKSILKLIIQ